MIISREQWLTSWPEYSVNINEIEKDFASFLPSFCVKEMYQQISLH